MTQIRVVSFGGCPLNNPMGDLYRRGVATSLFREMGFRRTPYALSSGAAVQLMRYCKGEIDIPLDARELCYADPDTVPAGEKTGVIDTGNLILVEMSTPIEIVYDGFVLNNNRVNDRLVVPLKERDADLGRIAARWRSQGLQRMNDAVRADTAAQILERISPDNDEDRFLRDIFAKTVIRETKTDAIVADLAHVRDVLNLPVGIILHNFNYMPDGRPVSWPPDFRENTIAAANRLGIPFYDPAELVEKYGTQAAMMGDMRHYSREFTPIVADVYHQFINRTLDRPVVPA